MGAGWFKISDVICESMLDLNDMKEEGGKDGAIHTVEAVGTDGVVARVGVGRISLG